jgi:VWFA-related protein
MPAANAAISNAPKPPALPPNTYSDFSPYPPSSAVNVLLIDDLNTPLTDHVYARKQIVASLKQLPPGTRMAVFTLSSRLRMVQGFTTDADLLARATSEKDDVAQSIAIDTHSESALEDLANAEASNGDKLGAAGGTAAQVRSSNVDQQETLTLTALRQIAHYLGSIPGRKNLIWFSESFPMLMMRGLEEDVRETDRLLTASRVAVYPVDARGLFVPESVNGASFDAAIQLRPGLTAAQSTAILGGREQQASEAVHLADQTMLQIADETGGKAFVNTNDFQAAIQ